MTDLYANFLLGIETIFSFQNLMYCFLGVTLGTIVGIIPGIGAITAISMLFPITYYLDPLAALVMLAGIYYGATYGGSTASILLNLPGTPSTAVTALDGYPMAKSGRAGVALFLTTIASFTGGSAGIVMLMLFSPIIIEFALQFGPAEYFSLILLGLVAASAIATTSVIKGIAMVVLGLFFGAIGTDIYTGAQRFTFGIPGLMDGVSLVALAMGLFGVAEVVFSVKHLTRKEADVSDKIGTGRILPTKSDMRRSWMPMMRGIGIGSFFGALPGTGPTVAAFISYAVEKKVSRDPSQFGKGAIEGIMGPESANNAADQTAFIPTLTLGIPGSATMALMLGVMIIHGIQPGPRLIADHKELFWGLVVSFWIGNFILLFMNTIMIRYFVKIILIPYDILYPCILLFVCVGVLSINNNPFDVYLVLFFGVLGYFMRLLDFPAAPLLLGFVLGPMLEEYFRRAMILSRGSFYIFVSSPLSATFLLITVGLLLLGLRSKMGERNTRREATTRT